METENERACNMKQFYVSQLKDQGEIMEFFMVKAIQIRVGSNKKEYLDLTLGDCSGEISAKKWDLSEDEKPLLGGIREGDLVRVKAQVTEWQGIPQLRVAKIRAARDADGLSMPDYVKAAPEKPEDMYEAICGVARSVKDPDLQKLNLALLGKYQEKLMYYPAASKNHHAEMGGLLWHMKRMLAAGDALCQVYTFLNRDLVLTGVIIHDLEKTTEILSNEYGVSPGYSFEGQLLGHIVQGIRELEKTCNELEIPREKAILLEHMILSHHYEPDFGSPKKPMFPEAEILHYLDIVDARMYDMEEAIAGIDPGNFSERVRQLDNRKIYKPTFEEGGVVQEGGEGQ